MSTPSPTESGTARVSPASDPDGDVIQLEPLRIVVRTDESGRDTSRVYDARELFDEANELLVKENYDDALRIYEQLVSDFAESRLVAPTLYNAGLAHEGKGEFDRAIASYRKLVAHGAKSKTSGRDALDGLIRLGSVLAELERWP